MRRKRQASSNKQTAFAPALTPQTSIAIATSGNVKETIRRKSSRLLLKESLKQTVANAKVPVANFGSGKSSSDFKTPRSKIEEIFKDQSVMQTKARSHHHTKQQSVVGAFPKPFYQTKLQHSSTKSPNQFMQDSAIEEANLDQSNQPFLRSKSHNQTKKNSLVAEEVNKSSRQLSSSKSSISNVSTQHNAVEDENFSEVTESFHDSSLVRKRRHVDLKKILQPLPNAETQLHEKISELMKQRSKISVSSDELEPSKDNKKSLEDHESAYDQSQSVEETSKASYVMKLKLAAETIDTSSVTTSQLQDHEHVKSLSPIHEDKLQAHERENEETDKFDQIQEISESSSSMQQNELQANIYETEKRQKSFKIQDNETGISSSHQENELIVNVSGIEDIKDLTSISISQSLKSHSSTSNIDAEVSKLVSAPIGIEVVSSSEKNQSTRSSLLQLSKSIFPNMQNDNAQASEKNDTENLVMMEDSAPVMSVQKTKVLSSSTNIKQKGPTLKGLNKVKRSRVEKAQTENLFLPRSQLKGILEHYSSIKFNKEAIEVAENAFLEFFKQLCFDMEEVADAAGRNTVRKSDLEQIMKKQGFITKEQPLHILIEELLPMEYRQQLIPCAKSVLADAD